MPDTYETVEANPQGPIDVLMAPIGGFYDPDSYAANAIRRGAVRAASGRSFWAW